MENLHRQTACPGHSPKLLLAAQTSPWCWRVTFAHLRGNSCLFELALQEIHEELSVLASEVVWRISVTHTTKEMLCPSVINHDAQAAHRRFWSRNLEVLTKKRESSLGDEVCWFLSVIFKLEEEKKKKQKNHHRDYKATQRIKDSRKVLDLSAENKLPLVQKSQFTSLNRCIYFLI